MACRSLVRICMSFLLLSAALSSPPPPKKSLEEIYSHLRFYFHDIFTGRNPTAVVAVKPMSDSKLFFGGIIVIDDVLTEGPGADSERVGRAEGMYVATGQDEMGLLMTVNFVFTSGEGNGSVLSMMGRNKVFDEVREMPLVGGTGVYRFARGYALARTHSFNLTTGDAVVEYNVYVIHY